METVREPDFRLISCQATLFTPGTTVPIVRLMKVLLPHWAELFDADPTLGPSAEGLPPEIPRLILQSTSQGWRCQIASARIDFFWQKPLTDSADIMLNAFFDVAIQRLNEYRELVDARVARLAAVLNRYVAHRTPGPFIARHFCQERWLPQLESCEVHFHKRFRLAEEFQVNFWVRSRTGILSTGEQSNHSIVMVEQDLNTVADDIETQVFDREAIERFFRASVAQLDASLELYYPAEGQP